MGIEFPVTSFTHTLEGASSPSIRYQAGLTPIFIFVLFRTNYEVFYLY